MLEKDFARLYRTSQEQIHAPADLVATTLATARDAQSADNTPRKPTPRMHRKPRWAMCIAACLAIVVVLFGGSAAIITGLHLGQPQVRAYAKTPNLLTAELDDGIVPFYIDDHTAMQGWGDGSSYGSYTGLQFTLEGNGISRVQATVSRGELYQVTIETYDNTTEEGTAILNEALRWKPLSIGTGEYLSEYDWVTPYFIEDGLERTDSNHKTQLRLLKRMGTTIDMPYEGEPLTFGLWFHDLKFLENGNPDLQDLDGTELTITAEYDDGAFRTQTMALHDAWFSFLPTDHAQGADVIMAEGPFETKPENSPSEAPFYSPMETLYGEVTSVTDEPHPHSLDNANTRGSEASVDTLLEEALGPRGNSTLAVEGTPSDDCIFDASETLSFNRWSPPINDDTIRKYEEFDTSPSDWVELKLSGISAHILDSLGSDNYISPTEGRDVIAFGGNYEYLNRIRSWTNGWTMSEDGQTNEGNSLVMMSVDLTNDSEETVAIDTGKLGTLCAIDHGADITTFSAIGAYAAKDENGRLWDRNNYDEITFQPHETLRLNLAFIVDDTIANAKEVYYALGMFDDVTQLGDFNEDIDSNAYVSLGKLDWKLA